uniref:G-protein coupled receptors family 1 profile domain-containing protein n=1 Tax=Meloidogyne floridensis TaxID=298350 RepID=A0A915P0V7_9BILA
MENEITDNSISIIELITIIVQCFLCSVGLLSNSFLALTIFRSPKLKIGCCGILLLILALTECVAQCSVLFLPTFLTLTRIQIPLIICFYAEFYGPYSQALIPIISLLISIDRLISILLPIRQVFCMPTDFIDSSMVLLISTIILLSNLGVLFIYTIIGLFIKFNVIKLSNDNTERKLYKSLIVLMAISLTCWLPTPIINFFVVLNTQLSQNTQHLLIRIALQLNKIAQTLNAPVLYICSSDYQNEMKKEFCRLIKFIKKNNSQKESVIGGGNSNPTKQNNNIQTPVILINNFVYPK